MKPLLTCPRCGSELSAASESRLCPQCSSDADRITVSQAQGWISADSEADADAVETKSEVAGGPTPKIDLGGPTNSRNLRSDYRPREATGRLQDYQILQELGRGGMGVVFKARQISLGRDVALKMILAGEFAGEKEIKRFHGEAEAAAHLDHPNIVSIYEIGEEAGRHFFSMQFVEGENLSRQIASFQKNHREAATIMAQIARAVHYAHQRGILHRDLKPGNILMDAQGKPHISDFGLAARLQAESELTMSGAILGTPSYMSPEQASGQSKHLTTATDIYSLGSILFDLLAGRPPFTGDGSLKILKRVCEEEPPALHSLVPGIDRDLETICLKCLEKSPTARYGSAEALAEDLERWLRFEPILARPSSRVERIAKWVRRKPVIAALVMALNLVVVVGLSGVVWQWLRAENRLVRLNVVNGIRLAREGDLAGALLWYTEALRLDKFHHGERDTHRLRIGSLLEQTPWLQRVWFSPLPVWLAQLSPQEDRLAIIRGPDAIANRFTGAELRAWDFVNGQAISPPILFSGGRPPMHRIRYQVFSPDGNQVVTIQTHDAAANGVVSEIVVHDAITGKPTLPPLSLEGLVSHVVFSRDGAFLVAAGKAGIARVWDLHRGGEWVGDFKHEGWVTTASFSPDGHYLLTGSMDKTAKLWDLAQREVLFTFPIGRFVMNAEFSHDGQKVVVAGSDFTAGQFRVWDVKTGGLICRPDIGEDGIQGILYHVSFSPDDRFIVAASSYGQVTVWSASTGRIVLPPLRHNNGVLTARFSSDGRQILSASYDTTARLWDARSGAQLAVLNQCMYVLDAAFTRDGRQVITASTDGMVRQWRLPVEPAGVLTMAHSNEVLHAEFSHDGRLVLTASADHKAGLWDAQTGHLLYWLPHEGTVYYATFSLDDKLIVTASEDGTARIWDPATGKQVGLALRHSNTVWHAEFDPTGTRVVTASGNFRTLAGRSSRLIREFPNPGMAERNPGGEARVWDVRTGQPLTGPLRHDDAVVYAGFSPDGNRVITTSADHTAQLWQLPQGAKTGATMKHIGIVFDANFSPNGKWVVTATGGEGSLVKGAAQLWDATTGQRKGRAFEHLDIVYGAKFSRDSRRVVTASDDATARIWDRSSGRALTPPIKNDSVPFGASFSPDDRFILTASEDGAARVWDAANGEFITQIRLHDHRLNSAVFSPNGTHILTASDDGTAKIIALPRTDWTLTDLSLLAEVLSARHLARHGTALEPLDEQQFEDSWTRLVERFPDRFGLSR